MEGAPSERTCTLISCNIRGEKPISGDKYFSGEKQNLSERGLKRELGIFCPILSRETMYHVKSVGVFEPSGRNRQKFM